MKMTTTNQFAANVNAAVYAVEEWQRGQCTWAECLRRCDLTKAGQSLLKEITRTTPKGEVLRIVTSAVAR
jgi:hypothetical protein